jgi:hypothetical protein
MAFDNKNLPFQVHNSQVDSWKNFNKSLFCNVVPKQLPLTCKTAMSFPSNTSAVIRFQRNNCLAASFICALGIMISLSTSKILALPMIETDSCLIKCLS